MDGNPLQPVESSEETREQHSREQQNAGSKNQSEEVESLRREIRELRDQVQEVDELRGEVEELEEQLQDERRPEPDYDCPGDNCDGWAVEELDPQHVEMEERTLASDRVEEIECPRCGEKMEPIEAGPETERGFLSRGITEAAKKGNAKKDMVDELEEKGRGEVVS